MVSKEERKRKRKRKRKREVTPKPSAAQVGGSGGRQQFERQHSLRSNMGFRLRRVVWKGASCIPDNKIGIGERMQGEDRSIHLTGKRI
jgi:hypothetical protein